MLPRAVTYSATSASTGKVDAVMDSRHSTPDLSRLKPMYSTRASRTVRWVVGVALTLNTAAAVLRLTDDPSAGDITLSALTIVFWMVFFYVALFGRPATRLTPNGPAVRRSGRWRQYLWTHVQDVQVQTRWTENSLLLLSDGRVARLVGMPPEDAQRLADALRSRPTT
jgi:hypothetical protein